MPARRSVVAPVPHPTSTTRCPGEGASRSIAASPKWASVASRWSAWVTHASPADSFQIFDCSAFAVLAARYLVGSGAVPAQRRPPHRWRQRPHERGRRFGEGERLACLARPRARDEAIRHQLLVRPTGPSEHATHRELLAPRPVARTASGVAFAAQRVHDAAAPHRPLGRTGVGVGGDDLLAPTPPVRALAASIRAVHPSAAGALGVNDPNRAHGARPGVGVRMVLVAERQPGEPGRIHTSQCERTV